MKKLLVLVLLAALLLPGCQSAQQVQPAPMQKDMEQMILTAQRDVSITPSDLAQELSSSESSSTPAQKPSIAERLGVPEKYVSAFENEDGKLKVDVNADIVLPNASSMPIYRVHPADFSQELVSAVFNELCGDKEMWYSRSREELSKSELEEEIRFIKECDFSQASLEFQESIPKQIEYLERLYEKAPDVPRSERCFGELRSFDGFTEAGEFSRTINEVNASTDDFSLDGVPESGGSFTARNNNYEITAGKRFATGEFIAPIRGATISYNDYSLSRNYGQHRDLRITELDYAISGAKNLSISPREAIRIAENFFAKVGITDEYMVESIYLTDDENTGNYDNLVGPAEHSVYRLHCVRQVDGIPGTYMKDSSVVESSSDYSFWPRWDYEYMEILIDDSGIFNFAWHSPLELGERINGDAELMPFSEIQEIFEKLMLVKYTPWVADYDAMKFSIDRVTLSLQRVSEYNSIDNGLLIPVWNFYGLVAKERGGKSEIGGWNGPNVVSSYISINAIDGSVIDTGKGF